MVVGERGESTVLKNQRHIKEMKDDIVGWNNELQYAEKTKDDCYKEYCNIMISICTNTLEQLERECEKFR